MKALIVGYGSIGARHARLLSDLSVCVAVVSSRPNADFDRYGALVEAIAAERPEYVVVANRTDEHLSTLAELAELNYRGVVLVEKPLLASPARLPEHRFAAVYVGYNLRFHPLLLKLREALRGETILAAHLYAGSYLPDWRPGQDYRAGYSAMKMQGGGVLRDLSHEVDLAVWLFGDIREIAGLMGFGSHLEIESEDSAALLARADRCRLLTIQLNYLDRVSRRELLVVTEQHSFKVDLVKMTFEVDGELEEFEVPQRDATYIAMHRAAMTRDVSSLCQLEEGMKVVEVIDRVEASAKKEGGICL